ncbi:hypothetical protein ACLK1S_05985 [Escherichia coli]
MIPLPVMNSLLLSGVSNAAKESAGEGLAATADGRNAVVSARGNFWDDENLQRRLASRLDRWVS